MKTEYILKVGNQEFKFTENEFIDNTGYWECLIAHTELYHKIKKINYKRLLGIWKKDKKNHPFDMEWIKTFLLYNLCISMITSYGTTIMGGY